MPMRLDPKSPLWLQLNDDFPGIWERAVKRHFPGIADPSIQYSDTESWDPHFEAICGSVVIELAGWCADYFGGAIVIQRGSHPLAVGKGGHSWVELHSPSEGRAIIDGAARQFGPEWPRLLILYPGEGRQSNYRPDIIESAPVLPVASV